MRIEELITGQAVNQKSVLDILGRLNIGDVIKAKVLEITSGELILRLFDGTVFKAAAAAEIDAKPGELLELSVSSKNDGNIVLETVKKENRPEAIQNELKKLLIDINVKPDVKNVELAGELKSAGLKFDIGLFEKAGGLLEKFKNLTLDKVVFIISNNIKPEEGNADTFIRLIEGRLKLGSQLDELQEVIFGSVGNTDTENTENISSGRTAGNILSGSNSSGNDNNNGINGKNIKSIPENSAGSNRSKAQSNAMDAGYPAEKQVEAAKIKNNSDIQPRISKQNVNRLDSNETAIFETEGKNTVPLVKPTNNIQKQESLQKFDDLGIDIPDLSPDAALMINNKVKKPEESLLNKGGVKDVRKESEALQSIKDSFNSLFVKTDSKDLGSELNAKKLYKDILEKLDSIRSAVQAANLPNTDDITARINNIDDGIKLLNQINNNSSYIQIPLNISGYNTTGELYILKRERQKKRIDPQNAVMLISLDTQNIGRIETVVDIKGRNLSINLRAEEKEIVDFIKDNFKYLYTGLLDKGYRLVDIKYRLIKEKVNPLNVERTVRSEMDETRMTVDIRV